MPEKTLPQAELDREYSPSSCVDDINTYLDAYARSSQRAKEKAIADGLFVGDVAYGASRNERLDLFLPSAPVTGPAPLHVYIHGGYWQALAKEDSLFAAPMFQDTGCYFAALNYTLAPYAGMTEIVRQNRRALGWLHANAANWGYAADQIYVSGSSAGAHLAIMMLLSDWTRDGLPADLVKGVCAVSGVYDLRPIRRSYVNEPLRLSDEEVAQNSPLGQTLRNRCPIAFAYGDNETGEFKRQTDDYFRFLQDAGETVCVREIEGRNHFDVIMDLMHADSWLAQQALRQMGLAVSDVRNRD